jgi:uncharacterized protein YciI
MFIVYLKFAGDKSKAAPLMQAHGRWLQQGFDDGVFVLAGSLLPAEGGAILAHQTSMEDLRERLSLDPFVDQGVVVPVITEVGISRADERLSFLR